MKHLLPLLLFALLSPLIVDAQKYTISGYVRDADSGEPLISANIYDSHSGAGAVTNTYGFYSLTLPPDSVELNVSYVGFESQKHQLMLSEI